ncbi:aminoglycoside phosphotransferase family protein [Amnibacterium kyonggiense]|uniref:Streptomycin 6-kinase n=1 Tax=Amnibacterium kyonggiense TaxID=595671 RepID=A0A4R7FLZ5_9MICO|nr:aminoglycoside phosphotransferase family protein [Amnibacterium kyonggiense]TDS77437.1 streptomycin 6-kinase [Amnibacterium kyonggiense]
MSADDRLRSWGAEPTGERWSTPSSDLTAGVLAGEPVILKIARIEEERRGGRLMAWWSAHGGLPVLAADDDAILMRRATGGRSLLAMSAAGLDDEAEEVLLDTVLALHAAPVPPAAVGLLPLRTWFRDLVDEPQTDPLLDRAASVARDLLAEDGPTVALHGDVHHGNVLDLGDRWAAIDPKGLVGHPAFDVANLCCNPTERTAVERLDRRLDRSAERLRLDRAVLEAWVVAWCGLSLAWSGAADSWHATTARRILERLVARR